MSSEVSLPTVAFMHWAPTHLDQWVRSAHLSYVVVANYVIVSLGHVLPVLQYSKSPF